MHVRGRAHLLGLLVERHYPPLCTNPVVPEFQGISMLRSDQIQPWSHARGPS